MELFDKLESDEEWRRREFPACRDRIFMAHAAVTTVPHAAIKAMDDFNRASGTGELDYSKVLLKDMDKVRQSAAGIIEADADEIALLGPTSLGLSLVANGIDWKEGDEIIAYLDDYPANVYPWKNLERLGVKTVFLKPDQAGEITPKLVKKAITPKTRMFALASCNFLTGYRIDIEAISALAKKNDILFCLDAIQTVGAFPTPAKQVDFLSADSHKWMLGPMTAGIFYVKKERFDELRPTLLGAWNVVSPNYIARDGVEFEPGGRRYEPGVLNSQGLVGMKSSIDLLVGIGVENVGARLLELKAAICDGLDKLKLEVVGPREGDNASGITTFTDREKSSRIGKLYDLLHKQSIVTSFRHDRDGVPYLRLSPHFYNTHREVEEVLRAIGDAST